MKLKKTRNVLLGLTAVLGSVFAISSIGYEIADTNRSALDNALGTKSYVTDTSTDSAKYKTAYAKAEDVMAKAKEISIQEGREGTVIMKNKNNALPISQKSTKIALFGAAAWKPFMQSAGDLKGGNADAVNLDQAFVNHGYTLDTTMKGIYDDILTDFTEKTTWGNTTITYNKGYLTTCGDMVPYQIREVPASKFTEAGYGSAASDWKSKIDKANTVGVVVFARGAGESNTYLPDTALDFEGNVINQDPLALSPDELSVVDAAKETCSKVVVLLNSGNTMEIGAIAEGGAHEVDAIGYMGVINDYQCEGIVDVLTGVVNPTGALPETYLKNNMSAPALQNFGGDTFADAELADSTSANNYPDTRYPDVDITAGSSSSSGFGGKSYNANTYIVEAEGIYVGYKYFETRYVDKALGNGSADSTKGATDGSAWSYENEVVYPFGFGLSYLDYEQTLESVNVDRSNEGNVTATIKITNKSDTKGLFLGQLYYQAPYTDYDKQNYVEKSAVNFLSSGKVEVDAHSSANVEITVPTKYLASYDYTKAKTYILDTGNYFFTAANGSHEAANNFLAQAGKAPTGYTAGTVQTWTNNTFDATTFATDHGKKVTNVMDNADMNYYIPGKVTYLSRQNWDSTWPINYNTDKIKIADASADKQTEWIKNLRGMQYVINENGTVKNPNGADNGVKFNSEQIGADQTADIKNEYWDNLVEEISVNEAVGAVVHGGGQTDTLKNIDNPIVDQNEGVNGTKGEYTYKNAAGEDVHTGYHFNIHSQTLMGSAFNPDLAYKWGEFMGDYSAFWLKKYTAWGTGLTLRRTPYNGRNYEYISEDPMLTNRIGYGILKGTADMGFICGPKHMGFNDQEHVRSGIGAYMNEQKVRETDLRGFQGGLEDGGGKAVMIAFNRIGATNASHSTGMLQDILRGEWGFTGIISTDLAGKPYFDAAGCIMAGITQVAEFGGNNSYINKDGEEEVGDSSWSYLTIAAAKKDQKLVDAARENLKNQLFTFANSAVLNVNTKFVTPWWDATISAVKVTSIVLTAIAAAAYVALSVVAKEDN